MTLGEVSRDGYKYATGATAQWAVGTSRHYKRIILAEKSGADFRYKVHKELSFATLEEAEAKAAELDRRHAAANAPEAQAQPEAQSAPAPEAQAQQPDQPF